MRIFVVGTKILGGGAGQHLGGPVPPPRPQRRTAPGGAKQYELTQRKQADLVRCYGDVCQWYCVCLDYQQCLRGSHQKRSFARVIRRGPRDERNAHGQLRGSIESCASVEVDEGTLAVRQTKLRCDQKYLFDDARRRH